MTLHHWQQHWRAQLPADSADLDLRLIAEHTTGLTPTAQRLRPDHPLDAATRHALDALAARRAQGEPLAYILGHQPFYDLDLRVTPATLIPRPDTETLVDAALARLPQDCSATVLDLGTGSGAIALAIGKHRPRATIIASDLSAEALAVARENACHNRIPNVHFVQTSWLAAFADHCADLIASNPPYIADGDPHLAALAHEPQTALTAGHDGLDDIRTLLRDAPRVLRPGGWLLFEHGYDQRDAIAALINHDDWASADFAKDYGGNWRICLL
ncbi:MAG: peptide chain release factor N(5)-glutamine methyltransferase, partial [Cardiobacteriaceae bacterium]|nr:peptide chain release factor N(5)-glutamine methyltransferase [Cardiobacteriaceae bacterium]